ncbi:nocturnin-like [Stigmatopora argus]
MNLTRRYSTLLNQMCMSSLEGSPSRRAFSPAPAVKPAAEIRRDNLGVDKSALQVKSAGTSITGVVSACPMGAKSSRPFSALAQTLSSSTLEQRVEHLEQEDLSVLDPDQLLRECQEVLQSRPTRPRRNLIRPEEDPSSSGHRLGPSVRIMQWNILAQALGEGKDGFVRCPLEALNWKERKYLILEEILTRRPDVVCLQEVDHYYDTFQPVMAGLGYHGSFLAKPRSPCLDVEKNNGPDGCALFYRRSRFSPRSHAHLRLSAAAIPTNQVAIAQVLQCRLTGRQLCVAVTHLKARSGWERLRSAQGADLLRRLGGLSAARTHPLVVCGDFNAEPSEDVHRRFRASPLGLHSAYKLLSADGRTEPPYTSWKIRPSGESRGTLDYIWYSRGALRVDGLLDIPGEEQIGPDRLPSFHYPSDHLSLICDISFWGESIR